MDYDSERRKPLVYVGVYSKVNLRGALSGRRHLEIEGVSSLSCEHCSSIQTAVRRAEVLSLRDNGFLKSLSDLKVEEMEGLEECWVERCHNIALLFPFSEFPYGHIMGPSERLWISDLGRLRAVCDGNRNFLFLKHLHIENCPKLENLFLKNPYLIKLETLHIRFCARLECVFKDDTQRGEHAFPQLRALLLWELPRLNHICSGSLLSLERLRIRACPKLRRFPRLNLQQVKNIEGESDWWRNLKCDNKESFNFQSKGPASI